MRILIGALAVALLAGCTTTQTSYDQAASVPASRAMAFQKPVSGPSAKILVTRDGGLLGGGCYVGVYVNGEIAARLGPGERASFQVPAGENLVGIGSDPDGNGLCAISAIPIKEISSALKDGQAKRFRISGEMSGGFSIGPSSF